MENLNDDTNNNDMPTEYQKIDLLFRCLGVHFRQIMAFSEQFAEYLERATGQDDSDKKRLYALIEVKADYAVCILELMNALSDEVMSKDANNIASYRHQLVSQLVRDIRLSKYWSNVLLKYQPNSENIFIKLWVDAMQRFERLAYLDC